jgi:hypothetical protein
MLRKAAKPSDAPKTSDVRLWMGVHDLSRVEWTATVPLPVAGERRYDVEFSVEIPANTFQAHSVWEHLQIFTRLQSPSEEGAIELERGDLEELRRDALGIAHRLRTLHDRVERAASDVAASLAPPPALARAVDENLAAAVALVAEVRRQLDAPGTISDDLRLECRLADEFLSHQLIDCFAGIERLVADARARDGDDTLGPQRRHVAESLADELAYRGERAWVTPRAESRRELTAFLDRASRLKKHFQDVLFLDAQSYFVDTRLRNWVGVVAAALAAAVWVSFTLLPFGPGTRAGLGIGTFAAVFALAYAVKDRVKELARGWITGRLMRLYGQRVVTVRLPARIDAARHVVCGTHETFDVVALERGPDPDALRDVGRPRRIVRLHFRMRAELQPAGPPLVNAHIDSVKHIFRYDLSPIFSRLDDSVKPVPIVDGVADERHVRFCDAPREYRFPAQVAYALVGGARLERDCVLVLSKRGIERIEAAG